MSDKPVLKVGYLPITDHLILGITKHKLDYEIEKINNFNIEPVRMNGWDYVGDALMRKELDAAFILAPYAMELFHSGESLKLLLLGHTNGSIIIRNSRATIEKVEDFKGKTILIPFHLSIHMMLMDKMLKEHGLEVGPGKDVVFEVLAPTEIPQAMEWDEEGELGGFIVAEPIGSQVVEKGFGEIFKLSKDLWDNHPCCVFVARDEIIAKYPDGIQELCNSFVKSGIFIEKKPDDAAKIGSRFLDYKTAILENVLKNPADRVKYSHLLPKYEPFEVIQEYMTKEAGAMSGKIDLEKFIKLDYGKIAGAK